MPYPTRYRSGRGAALRSSLRDFFGNESGLLRFPDFDHGTWAHPIGDPIPPSPPPTLPPPATPLIPPDPATRRQQDIPWFERGRGLSPGRFFGALGLAVAVADMLWPSGQNRWPFTPAAPGMTHQCGPTGWPGPPYQRSLQTMTGNAQSPPLCGLGGQAFAASARFPTSNTHTIYYVWGPNMALLPAERWFIDEMFQWPVGPPPQLMTFAQVGLSLPTWAVGQVGPGENVNAQPWPEPFSTVPRQQVADTDQATTRGDTITYAAPRALTSTGTGGLKGEIAYPEIRPRPRERERKVDPLVGRFFQFFSQVGTWHSFVDALWRSLPPRYSHRRRNFQQRLLDIYQHYDEIDLDRAARYLFQFWLKYKVASMAYGRAQETLVRWFGPNAGMYLYRGLVQSGRL